MTAGRSISSTSKLVRRVLGLALALAALAALLPGSVAQAATRLEVPEESPGVPAYARVNAPVIAPHTDDWAPIFFYRDPACVPSGFNLLSFFDAPRAFGCPLTVKGFEIWEHGPGTDPAPRLTKLRDARAVPVWLVSWPQLEVAAADGTLTIAELRALPSLITGVASHFRETLHPTQSNNRGKINIGARGTLSDGRSFRFKFVAQGEHVRHASIRFR